MSVIAAPIQGNQVVLPLEIWVNILQFTDLRTLWTSLRQTSHVLRREAEREFRISRLHRLHISWDFIFKTTSVHGHADSPTVTIKTTTSKARIPEDGVAIYDLELPGVSACNTDTEHFISIAWEQGAVGEVEGFEEAAMQVFRGERWKTFETTICVDDNGMKRWEIDAFGFSKDALPWRNVDLKKRQIEIDWRQILNANGWDMSVTRCE